MTIEEIVEREVKACFPSSPDVHPDLRLFGAIIARSVIEECAKIAPHDLDCHDEDAPCENDTCAHGCDETCPQRRIRALAAQGPGGEKGR